MRTESPPPSRQSTGLPDLVLQHRSQAAESPAPVSTPPPFAAVEVVKPREVPREVVKPREVPKEVVKPREASKEVVKSRETARDMKPKEASVKEGAAVCLKFGQVPLAAVKSVDCITLSSDEEGAPQDAPSAPVKEEEVSLNSPEVIILVLLILS